MSHIQERMKRLGIKQVDLILELRKRGRGIAEGAIYWGLFLCPLSRVPALAVVRVRSCWALLRACPLPRFHWGIFY